MLTGYITYKGWMWPEGDRWARQAIIDRKSWKDIEDAMPYVGQRRTVVQAGGHCGVWATHLAKRFQQVYCFEPHPVNFPALVYNTAHMKGRVHCFQAALGDAPIHITLDVNRDDNSGAHHVSGMTGTDGIPTMRLDDLALGQVDLVILDVEGFERNALRGGQETLLRCKPVVMMEDKGLDAKHHGIPKGAAVDYLQSLGYEVRARVARDVILTHKEPNTDATSP